MGALLENRYLLVLWGPKKFFRGLINNPASPWEIFCLYMLAGLVVRRPENVIEIALICWVSTYIAAWTLNKLNVKIALNQLATAFAFLQLPRVITFALAMILPSEIGIEIMLIGYVWAIVLFIIALMQYINENIFGAIGAYLVFQIILAFAIYASVSSHSGNDYSDSHNKREMPHKRPVWMEPLKLRTDTPLK